VKNRTKGQKGGARVVRQATKKPLAEFAGENIFRPLRNATYRFYADPSLVVPGSAPAYDPGGNGSLKPAPPLASHGTHSLRSRPSWKRRRIGKGWMAPRHRPR
jgi:CubicO group peptidase (beta-lactamase class C family)